MGQTVIMPKAGMSMLEGKIVKWLKKEGETVEKGEVLLEIETDKTTMEVEAEYAGVLLKILKADGETVPVTETIGFIGAAGEMPVEAPAGGAPAAQGPAAASEAQQYDVAVIGGGPAGYIAAIKAARLGGRTVLVEKDTVGGTCLNRGCIPTKNYLKTAEMISHIHALKNRGVTIKNAAFLVDMPKAVEEKNRVVKKLTSGVAALLKSNGVDVLYGEGVVKPDKTIVIDGQKKVSAQKVIYAGGSKAQKIKIPGAESKRVLTSDEILDLTKIPVSLAIIGGGVIGVEMATVFNRFGSKVRIVELEDRIIPQMDAEISKVLRRALEDQGIEIFTGVKITALEETQTGLRVMTDKVEPYLCDLALLSIGRIPDASGLREMDITMERGRVKTNDHMQTSVDWIYAPGDINGRLMLAHAAFKMGEIAALNALGHDESVNLSFVPSCIYTMPEVGCVGLTEEQAKGKYNVSVGKFPFNANGRALASGDAEGFIKVITDKRYGEILGVHIIGPNAAEMVNEAAALMSMEITAEEISNIIHAHPTYSEAFMEAAADSIGACLHLPPKG